MDENSEELHIFYNSPNIVWVIKYRILKGTRHVARMQEIRSVSEF